MLPPRVLQTMSEISYGILVLATIVATGLSCTALLSQAVRSAPNQSWSKNFNALVIGASYVIVLVASLLLCIKRRVAVRLKLQRISKVHRAIDSGDVPKSVHEYITQEYGRACLVAHESLPKNSFHEGWGRPGTKHEGVHFRRALLDKISTIDDLAHFIIPSHPTLKPHARMLHHFRFILPLLSKDEDGLTPLHYFDSAVQLARNSARELIEHEFELGLDAARDIETRWVYY
ncbi:hypothetical protein BD779DRAFT_1431517 [Infundibulicybe gibba]|nr:hypothetical protein BD779DRAFT_1431517 [Infundibulicybe gibba]